MTVPNPQKLLMAVCRQDRAHSHYTSSPTPIVPIVHAWHPSSSYAAKTTGNSTVQRKKTYYNDGIILMIHVFTCALYMYLHYICTRVQYSVPIWNLCLRFLTQNTFSSSASYSHQWVMYICWKCIYSTSLFTGITPKMMNAPLICRHVTACM